jgi:hypothetical protein
MGFELIKVGDDFYTVERTIPEHTGIDTNLFKKHTNTTNVFRRDGLFWFCRLIEEVQIIEDKPVEELLSPKENLEE